MLIRLDDIELLDDLCAHFRRSGFDVAHAGGGTVDVRRADAPSVSQEHREVLMHLRIWQIINPGSRSEIL